MRKGTISNDKLREMDVKTGGRTLNDAGFTYIVTVVKISDFEVDDDDGVAIQCVTEISAHATEKSAIDHADKLNAADVNHNFGCCDKFFYYVTSRYVPKKDCDDMR